MEAGQQVLADPKRLRPVVDQRAGGVETPVGAAVRQRSAVSLHLWTGVWKCTEAAWMRHGGGARGELQVIVRILKLNLQVLTVRLVVAGGSSRKVEMSRVPARNQRLRRWPLDRGGA